MEYKNAFNCKKCPERSDKYGCPCWIEMIWENSDTEEKKVEKGCYFQIMPKLSLEAVKSANISTEHSCQMRNGFYDLFELIKTKLANNIEYSNFKKVKK